ncbi:hypothetical protein Cst_c05440 [Thermoclostridium stercorarium subsp. stercorarium DSM 8532]|jgi:uncharacterized protein YlxW (UPF0749 family)|uniref:Division initiation protein n=3 Tax=Thermoclostridium stercorarium TaxID=1510 RepID=L7VM38_THES1|nr:DUF881 domain-containing protein [Thermoclostridium stercorarium]AGC67566.1 hypothetical protein Cst_c05440 [Thermoclostridium stercorarium subsp. stercorarium DSM 8532]AGI38615.1 hypothetical protein Clst_0518 [Thermoclostridium stercorarium subsp. stercorarium DSM 8532]ANW97988.1 hypothetical protein CSTERTH_02495 [Thermoclostridium stercorarium subsp. thermolacticum DSM 2910]ANX00538.1 hypothetical protein CSTERLE_02485 [Thermoclostridium stercorarium subsp. leptospartum DSM 9219]
MHKTKGVLFVVFLLFGMIITMQFRTILLAQQQSSSGQTSVQTLSYELEQAKSEGIKLLEELQRLEKEKNEIIRQLSNDGNPIINELLNRKNELMVINGLTDVKGSGIVITLNDAPARGEIDPSQLIIHDMDIVQILNVLRAAGAQAISINDERIIATSKHFCVGPTILINNKRYPVPYVIKAIGDPNGLYNAVEQSEAVVIMKIYNIQVDVRKENEILIPGYKIYGSIDDMISGLEVVEK